MSENQDSYLIGILEKSNFRFLLTDCTSAISEAVRRHELEGKAAFLLSKVMIGSFFLAGMVKEENTVSIQLEGEGDIRSVLAYSDRYGRMRGMVRKKEGFVESPANSSGKGIFRVTRWGGERRLHQSVTKMEPTGFESNLLNHIYESDQLISFLIINSGPENRWKGMIFQALPGTEQKRIDEMMDRFSDVDLSADQLMEGDMETILFRMTSFLKEDLKVLDSGKPEFYCGCSLEKIQSVIRSIGKEEARSIIEEQGKIEIVCEFCRKPYVLDPEEVNLLFM